MNEAEYLISKLIEECSEVIKACTKAQTFGLDDTWPGEASGLPEWKLTPRQEIRHELNDLMGVSLMLRTREILPPELTYDDDLEVDAKIAKVLSLMPYSQKAGTLQINED